MIAEVAAALGEWLEEMDTISQVQMDRSIWSASIAPARVS